MIIQNRKSGVITRLTKQDWAKIQQLGKSDLFIVIDPDDNVINVEIPLEIREFQVQMPKKIETTPKTQKKKK